MGMMEKFANLMRLNPDEDDEFYDEEELYDEPARDEFAKPSRPSRPARAEKPKRAAKEDYIDDEPEPTAKRFTDSQPKVSSQKVTPMRPTKKTQGGNIAMEVCVIKPKSIEEAREITETLLNNRTVVLNMEGLDFEIAQRIIDFTSGSCYAIDGNLQKISNYIFIVTPKCVDITGDFQSIMDAFDPSSIRNDI